MADIEATSGRRNESLTSKQRGRRRRRRNVTLAVGAVVALCAAGGGVAYAATQGTPADNYRTATAATGNVTETVNLSGTIASVNRRNVAFQAAGTVGGVNVTIGQSVAAGATLATLDPASLTAALTAAQDTVTKATTTLTDDLASQTAGVTTSTASKTTTTSKSAPAAPSSSAGSSAGSSSGASSAATAAIQTAAKAVTTAQQNLLAQYAVAAAALTTSQGLVTAVSPTCQPFLAATVSSGTTTTSSTGDTGSTSTSGSGSTSTSTPPPTSTPAPTPDPLTAAQQELETCQSAITGVLTSQQATNAAQQQLQTDATDLNTAVATLSKALQAGTGGAPSTGGAAPSQPSAPAPAPAPAPAAAPAPASGGTGGSAGGTTVASAATIVADEAAITAANAQLTIAQNDQSLGNLTSPIAGTVAAVSITPGSNVTAGSTTQVITVIGNGGYVVNSTATVTNVSKLKVNQPVTISVAGSSKQLAGTVSSIGMMNVSTSTSPSFNVTVAISDKTATLLNGTSAKLAVTAATATSVLTIPTSALHRNTNSYTVNVLKNGQSVPTTVKTGATGDQVTEITSGLSKGDVVILADISSTVGITSPTTSTSTGLSGLGASTTTTTGRGGFGGGAGGRPGGGGAPAGG
ncbi:MAG: hypothetical protein QOF36_2001 [Microbacteriaceae bacterium]|nr:hypothetical protein [Microbacteriaceae bacterium]